MSLDRLLGTWDVTMRHRALPEPVSGQQRCERVLDGAFLLLRCTYDHPDVPDALAVLDDRTCSTFDVRGVSRVFDVAVDDAGWTQVRRDEDFWQRSTTRSTGPSTMEGTGENSYDRGATWEHDFSMTWVRVDPMSSRPQVRLVPATVPLLLALQDDPGRFRDLIGSPVPDGWPEFPEAVGAALAHLRNAPEADRSWSMQLFVDHDTGRLVGSGGFAAPPLERTVEIGYEVAPAFRGQGFGGAAARALVEHAVASGEVDHVTAHTLPGPNPSTGVLVSVGFEHVGDQQDSDVGVVWEWRWSRRSEA